MPLALAALFLLRSVFLAPGETTPEAPLHQRSPLGGRPKFKFISVSAEMSANCSKPSSICFSISPSSTMRISRFAGTPFGEIQLYRRAPAVGEREVDAAAMWDIQFVANLNPKNINGNVVFIVCDRDDRDDRDDPTAPALHAYTALREAQMTPFHFVAAQEALDTDAEGFHSTHTYLLRVVQQWNQREVVLARGTFRIE